MSDLAQFQRSQKKEINGKSERIDSKNKIVNIERQRNNKKEREGIKTIAEKSTSTEIYKRMKKSFKQKGF